MTSHYWLDMALLRTGGGRRTCTRDMLMNLQRKMPWGRLPMAWNSTRLCQELQRLATPGILGRYTSFEVTELVLLKDKSGELSPPANVLTVIVGDRRDPGPPPGPARYACTPPPQLGSHWKFGVSRYRIPLHELSAALATLSSRGVWKPGQFEIGVGALDPLAPIFVAPDGATSSPWNSILKNNFWNGSYVLELFDADKHVLEFLVADTQRQIDLSKLISRAVPWGLDAMPDRLGSIVIQLPVTELVTKVRGTVDGDCVLRSAWRHAIQARPIRATAEVADADGISGYSSMLLATPECTLELNAPSGSVRYTLWDDANQVILGASPPTTFIRSIVGRFSLSGPNNVRTFQRNSGGPTHTVQLSEQVSENVLARASGDPQHAWRTKRRLTATHAKLTATREFVQYGAGAAADTERALSDIRALITLHGEGGAWLWDPYLRGQDLLDTLFYCPYSDVELRALTAAAEPVCVDCKNRRKLLGKPGWTPCSRPECQELAGPYEADDEKAARTRRDAYRTRQIDDLDGCKGNLCGLNLEYRMSTGPGTWAFHDRFLIFPDAGGAPLAWSLGTSVNSVGKQHHILQKAANAELIRRSFDDLWSKLTGSEHLIWKSP
ncbi:VPA1262 family N-terminal domain-containing protein [Lysobacter humi (ex Lee et al. 2017)]